MNHGEDDHTDDMRRAILAALPLLMLPREALAQDASRVQPRAYRVVFENEKLRVIEFNSRPGMGVCGTGVHSHPPHLNVALSPARVKVRLADGRTVEGTNQAGDVWWSPAETHETENITGRDVRALIVELKPDAGKA
jgi:hypothetical protein